MIALNFPTASGKPVVGEPIVGIPAAGVEMFNAIDGAIRAGKTVYLHTMTRTTVITPKTYAKWADGPAPLFRVSPRGELSMASGKRYVCIATATAPLVGITVR